MTRARTAAIMVAISLLLAGAGCGGGGSGEKGSTASQAPPTRTEFVARMNAICKEKKAGLKTRVARFFKLHSSSHEPRPVLYHELAHFVLLPTIEAEMAPFFRVTWPPRDRERLQAMLSMQRITIDEIVTDETVPSLAEFRRRFASSGRLFRAYGLYACANGPVHQG